MTKSRDKVSAKFHGLSSGQPLSTSANLLDFIFVWIGFNFFLVPFWRIYPGSSNCNIGSLSNLSQRRKY